MFMDITAVNTLKTSPLPLFDTLQNLSRSQPAPKHIQQEFARDYHQAAEFLYQYRGSEATFNAYRREIERLLHWSWNIANKSIGTLDRGDIEAFIQFCQHPPKTWIGQKNVARYRLNQGQRIPNPDWRVFVSHQPQSYALSQKALQAIFAIIGSFYTYLIQEEYISANPVLQIRQKSKFIRTYQQKSVVRRLSELQWSYVIETAERLANTDPAHHERTLFVMNALYAMYLRISELAASSRWTPHMGDFRQDSDGNWWFVTVGKGNKERQITVSDAMLMALKRYRQSLDLSPLPAPGENTPLITKQGSAHPLTSTRQIRNIVKYCFNEAIANMLQDGFSEEAAQLQKATVHWLRHTGISDDVKHRPREHVRDDAGHSSSAITDKYIDVELRRRHASGKHKKIKPED